MAKRVKNKSRLIRVYKKHEGKCQYCGRMTIMVRKLKNFRMLPFYFIEGILEEKLVIGLPATVDHIVPLSKGGKNGDENATLACLYCNNKKDRTFNRNLRCKDCGGFHGRRCYQNLCDDCIFPQLLSMLRESLGEGLF